MPVVVRAANLAGFGLELPEWLYYQVKIALGTLGMPFLELTAAHPATPKKGRGLLRPAVVVEERNAPTAAGSRLGGKIGQPFLSWPLALFCRHFRSSFLFASVEGEDATCPRLEPNRSIMGG